MGLNICLYKSRYEEHPDWDCIRQGNDRNFAKLINWDNVEYLEDKYQEPVGFIITDIAELREKVTAQKWGDEERYLKLLQILESEPSSYLYFSN